MKHQRQQAGAVPAKPTKKKFRVLPAVQPDKALWDEIEKRIRRQFRKFLYGPLLQALRVPVSTIENAKDSPLVRALKEGRVTFSRGVFRGKFTAAISREIKEVSGTSWDAEIKGFRVPKKNLPANIVRAVEIGNERYQASLDRMNAELKKNLPVKITKNIETSDIFATQLWKVDKDVRDILKEITVSPILSRKQRDKIAREWSGNMEKWITDFSEKEIRSLRRKVKQSVFAGNRYESLIETIKDSYGVTTRKARFLARQESNLLVAKYAETKLTSQGIHEYRWDCVAGSPAHPVRPSHKKLNGRVFRFDKPPVTTGPGEAERRNNPGEDFNCRCKARPIVRF
jgi:SPP1 gp7 family putative phage head morphogenesis protein